MADDAADAPPLAGIRVVDLCSYYPGPLCTSVLADLGAEVVKVERPGDGDPGRAVTPGTHRVLNRRKRIVQLDLKSPADRAAVLELVDGADVVVVAFRSGAAERLGVGGAELTARNPRLVHCSISGFGSASTAAAHDFDVSARAGLLWMSGDAERQPRQTGMVPHVDVATASYAAQAILAALFRRERTGTGACLEVPMTAAALKLLEPRLADHEAAGLPSRRTFLDRPAYAAFRAGDGRLVGLAGVTDGDWAGLLAVLGPAGLPDDPRLRSAAGRKRHADVVLSGLDAAFATRPAAEWIERLEAVDVPVAPVHSPEELAADPLIAALGVLRPGEDGRGLEVAFPVSGLGVAPAVAR
jgi:crotonobetainyl-CoA:carnitine CoA-transferase CaiB-like acyl-CoA transferase